MRDIKFDLIYRGETGFHHKKYYLSELMVGINKICDIHHMMELVAKRQYTGLKDKNGVEIYEGDILNFDWRLQATGELYASDCENISGVIEFSCGKFVVRYFNKSMSFDVADINQVTFERLWRETYPRHKDGYYKMTGFEVIGNTYENPELLGE